MRAQCCICSDLFESSLTVNIAACPCGHTFHEQCLMRWMDTSSTCPSCRTNIKKKQIIKRLFFDVREKQDEDDDVDKMLNQISNLKAQLCETERQRRDLIESRDNLSAQFAVSEAERQSLLSRLNEEYNLKDIMQKDIKLLRKENAVFVEEIRESMKTKKKLQEMQNIELILKDCETDVHSIVMQHSEVTESSIKQLASLLTVVKREYNQVVSEKKVLRDQVSKLKHSIGHYHSVARKYKEEVINLQADLDRTSEHLSQVEKDSNKNRRKLVHLRNAVRHKQTEGSTSFHQALNEESPNVAYTPTRFQDERSNNVNMSLSPDLFDKSPVSINSGKRKMLSELNEPKLKFANIATASERIQTLRDVESSTDDPRLPQTMINIIHKKQTDCFKHHVPSVITRGYDGFGGSTSFIHPHKSPVNNSHLKFVTKKPSKSSKVFPSKMFVSKQRPINYWSSSLPSTKCSLVEESVEHNENVSTKASSLPSTKCSLVEESGEHNEYVSTGASSLKLWNVPTLSSDDCDFIDLT